MPARDNSRPDPPPTISRGRTSGRGDNGKLFTTTCLPSKVAVPEPHNWQAKARVSSSRSIRDRNGGAPSPIALLVRLPTGTYASQDALTASEHGQLLKVAKKQCRVLETHVGNQRPHLELVKSEDGGDNGERFVEPPW